jgi:UDP-N-acetylmuramoyl-L-alanyl-D-glutamate--2,6-diaminopimelate ligase
LNLDQLVDGLPIDGGGSVSPRDISIDTRSLGEGDLFVAREGHDTDGHNFLAQAVEEGASALLIDRDKTQQLPSDTTIPVLKTDDTGSVLPELLHRFYGEPSRELTLVGVTGTNGKTTTTHLLKSILEAESFSTGLIGTIAHQFQGEETKGDTTTPSIVENYRRLREWSDHGADAVVMEVSSHGLDQGRVEGLSFDVGVFTNLSQDHLNYHGSMENYFEAKRRLITMSEVGVSYADDEYGRRLIEEDDAVGVGETGEYKVTDSSVGLDGIAVELHTPTDQQITLNSPLTGLFNWKNISLAAVAGHELGLEWDTIQKGIRACDSIPGRCERLEGPPQVIVDYAHTPDAMDNVIDSIHPLVDGELICVFGAGGDRDRTKRPKMGRIAAEKADWSVVTSDNPRSEPPMQIIEDILEGMNGAKNYDVEEDRGQAIRHAIERAGEKDLVLIVGRGHETEQIIGDRVIPFKDKSVAEEVIASLE